jgi:hypothetical protein
MYANRNGNNNSDGQDDRINATYRNNKKAEKIIRTVSWLMYNGIYLQRIFKRGTIVAARVLFTEQSAVVLRLGATLRR